MKIYLCKGRIMPLDMEKNRLAACRQIEKAKAAGADLAVLARGYLTGVQRGILADSRYFDSRYNSRMENISKKYPDMYILADKAVPGGFENTLYKDGQRQKGDSFEIYGFKIRSFACEGDMENADCTRADRVIVNATQPVLAGERFLSERFLSAFACKNGVAVYANYGRQGLSSHPDVYIPAIGFFDGEGGRLSKGLEEYDRAENLFEVKKGTAGGDMRLPKRSFAVNYSQNPMIPAEVSQKEYCLDLFELQTAALANRLENIGAKAAVVALSGGLDSALAFLVAVNAFDMLGWDRNRVHPVSMPGFGTSKTTKSLAAQLAESLGFQLKMIDITAACTQALKDIGHDGITPDVTFENVQARMRTVNGLNLANSLGGIMIGTGDLSEEALGFSTYGGDQLASYNVNSSISKTVIRTMLPYVTALDNLKAAAPAVQQILNIPVSPELVPHGGEILQKTEEILAPYKLIDFYTYCFVYAKISPSQMVYKAKEVFGEEFSLEYLKEKAQMYFRRFIGGQFKRSCAPEGAALTHLHLNGPEKSLPSDGKISVFAADLDTVK